MRVLNKISGWHNLKKEEIEQLITELNDIHREMVIQFHKTEYLKKKK